MITPSSSMIRVRPSTSINDSENSVVPGRKLVSVGVTHEQPGKICDKPRKSGATRSLSPKKLAPNGGSLSRLSKNHKNKNKTKSLSPKTDGRNNNHDHHHRTHHSHNNVSSPYRSNHRHRQSPMTVLVKRVHLLDGAAAAAAAKVEKAAEHPHLISFEKEDFSLSRPQESETTASAPNDNGTLQKAADAEDSISSSSHLPSPIGFYAFQSPYERPHSDTSTAITTIRTNPQTNSSSSSRVSNHHLQIAVMRVSSNGKNEWKNHHDQDQHQQYYSYVTDDGVANPHPSSVVHDKYWAQRHRLFSRFDQGVMLDSEGWYSVTPEVIADHVASRLGQMVPTTFNNDAGGIVVLDAFCGMGGNSIAFGKISSHLVSLVVCVDVDRSKLRLAAHNASLYNIPKDKILFIESNSLFVMDQCYREGKLSLKGCSDTSLIATQDSGETGNALPVLNRRSSFEVHHSHEREQYAGYTIGGLDLLPPHIDAIFMDPPWGGIDYGAVGKSGYDLKKHMKINYYANLENVQRERSTSNNDGKSDTGTMYKNVKEEYNKPAVVDGFSLLKIAAAATSSKFVIYDIPRNTNKISLGQAALAAGYQGNMLLEEQSLNGRIKTFTAYLGKDFHDSVSALVDA